MFLFFTYIDKAHTGKSAMKIIWNICPITLDFSLLTLSCGILQELEFSFEVKINTIDKKIRRRFFFSMKNTMFLWFDYHSLWVTL